MGIIEETNKIIESANKNESSIKFPPQAKAIMKDIAAKHNGTLSSKSVEFKSDKDFANAVKALRQSGAKNLSFVFVSNKYDTGYMVSPLKYSLGPDESLNKTESAEGNSLLVMLDNSLSEENKAVADYEDRASECEKQGNHKAAELFRELARDEKVHAAQLLKARELFGLNDAAADQEGSEEAEELFANKGDKQ